MQGAQLAPGDVEIGLRAVKAVAMADDRFTESEHRLLQVAARALAPRGQKVVDIDAIEEISPEDAAQAVVDETTRARIVQAQIIMALIDGDVEKSEHRVISKFAKAFDVDEPRLANLKQVMEHHHLLLKLDLNRQSRMIGDAMLHAYRKRGLRGAWKTIAPFLDKSLATDDELAWKYRKLGLLPDETFGRQYWIHMRERGFAFPGEPSGFPEEFIKHDCCHVLGGYDTDPAGECQVVAFICGFMKADPFWYLFMIAVHMHLGIETFHKNELGFEAFDPDIVIAALQRGAAVTEDLYVPGFDWWPLFELPLDDVRAKYRVA